MSEEVWRVTAFRLEGAVDQIEEKLAGGPINPFIWAPPQPQADSGVEDN